MKGFKGKYFTLNAIQACTTTVTLHASTTATSFYTVHRLETCEETEESPPEELCLDTLSLESDSLGHRACHCNQLFLNRVKALWQALYAFLLPSFDYSKIMSGISPPCSRSTSYIK